MVPRKEGLVRSDEASELILGCLCIARLLCALYEP